jgi:hypothetical protein
VTTGLDVLADAVKIGLGAVVALIGTTLTRRDQWKKDRLRNRLQAIERVGEEFDAGFHKFADYMTDALAKKALGIRVDTPLEFVMITILTAYLPFAGALGFQPMPGHFYPIVAAIIIAYIGTAEFAKRLFYRATIPALSAVNSQEAKRV